MRREGKGAWGLGEGWEQGCRAGGWGPPQPGSPGMVHGGHFVHSPFCSLSEWQGRKSCFVLRRSELGKLPDPSWALRVACLQRGLHQGHGEGPIHTPTPGFSLEGELPACLLLGKEMHWFLMPRDRGVRCRQFLPWRKLGFSSQEPPGAIAYAEGFTTNLRISLLLSTEVTELKLPPGKPRPPPPPPLPPPSSTMRWWDQSMQQLGLLFPATFDL